MNPGALLLLGMLVFTFVALSWAIYKNEHDWHE